MKSPRPHPTHTNAVAASASALPSMPTAPWRRLTLFLVAAQCLALVLLGVLLLNKHSGLLAELTLSRMEVKAGDMEAALRTGLLAGLRPEEMQRLGPMLERILADDPGIAALEIFTVEDGAPRIVEAGDRNRVGSPLRTAYWQALAGSRAGWHAQTAEGPVLGLVVRDEADEIAGGLVARAAPEPLAARARAMQRLLWPRISGTMALMILATLVALAVLPRLGGDRAALRSRVMAVALLTTVAAGAQVAWSARDAFAEDLKPAVAAKVESAAGFLAGKVARARELGIPLEQLPGVADAFTAFMARHPEVASLRLADAQGRVLAEKTASPSAGPWVSRSLGDAGSLSAAADEEFVARRLAELAADIAVVLLVAILVFRELLAALMGSLGDKAPGAPTATERLQSLRLPLFLFILTEEMSRAFLPLYLKEFATGAWLGKETEVGLPIAIYMLCFALATPIAGRWADRFGVARVFAAGVALTVAGFAWTALAGAYWQLLPARALCAWGYATGTMACQRQLIVLTGAGERARGLALFVGAVGIAAICGSSLGGLLADQIGFRPVFAVSALLALMAFGVFRLTQGDASAHGDGGPPLHLAEVLRLLRDRRFAALMLGAAIPAKLALAGFLFYLAPLALQQEGFGTAAIGRAVMLYFVLVAAINPLASHLSDRFGWRLSLTMAGGGLIGLGGLAGLMGGEAAVLLGIAALGIGTGLATAPMQALASEIGARSGATSVAVVLRTIERLGSAVGPLWAGAWLAYAAWGGAMVAIGIAVLAGTMLCLAARTGRQP